MPSCCIFSGLLTAAEDCRPFVIPVTKRPDSRRDNILPTILITHIALAFHAERGQTVAGDLRNQHAAHALNEERERAVLKDAFVAAVHGTGHAALGGFMPGAYSRRKLGKIIGGGGYSGSV